MTVAVVIPWQGGCPYREQALTWVRDRWAKRHPSWPVLLGVAPDGSWCKADAVVDALARTDADIIVVADGDVWCDQVADAVAAVESGARWAVPHGNVHRLTEDATTAVLVGTLPDVALPVEQAPYLGVPGGGIVALSAETFWSVPLDPRFEGWGGEDEAWGLALEKLAGSPRWGDAPLWHLWHPPQPRRNRHVGSPQNQALLVRYQTVRTPAGMRSLVDEARRML